MDFLKPNIEKLRLKNNIKGLLQALSHKDASVRSDAVNAIGCRFEGHRDSREKEEAAMSLVKMRDDSELKVRESAVYAIGKMQQAGPLIELLEKGEKPLRIIAASVMGNLNHISVKDALIIALKKDNDEDVRSNAAVSLGRIIEYRKHNFDQYNEISDKKIMDECCKVLVKSLGDTPSVCSKALWALAKSKNAGIIPHLIKGLDDEHEEVRKEAAVGLGIAGPVIGSEGVDALMRIIQKSYESDEIRECAIRALGSVRNDIALQALLSLKKSAIADDFKKNLDYAIKEYPAHTISAVTSQQEQKGLYWAYLHKYGKIQVREWYHGNAYIQEAVASPNVKNFLEEPFEAGSIEEAEEIAAKLLSEQK